RLGGHRGPVVGMDGAGHDPPVGDERVLHELLGQLTRLAQVDLPVHDEAGEDVEHHIQVIELAWPRTWKFRVGVGLGRGSGFSPGPFPRPALRTRRAPLDATGSPRVHAIAAAESVDLAAQGVGIFAPRYR